MDHESRRDTMRSQNTEDEVEIDILPEQALWFAVIERFCEDLLRPAPLADGVNYRTRAIKDWMGDKDHIVSQVMPLAGLSDSMIERMVTWINHVINVEVIDKSIFPDAHNVVNDKGEVLLFKRNFRRQRTPVR